jgi:hypothetical protein
MRRGRPHPAARTRLPVDPGWTCFADHSVEAHWSLHWLSVWCSGGGGGILPHLPGRPPSTQFLMRNNAAGPLTHQTVQEGKASSPATLANLLVGTGSRRDRTHVAHDHRRVGISRPDGHCAKPHRREIHPQSDGNHPQQRFGRSVGHHVLLVEARQRRVVDLTIRQVVCPWRGRSTRTLLFRRGMAGTTRPGGRLGFD